MNVQWELSELSTAVAALETKRTAFLAKWDAAKKETARFLACCQKVGIKCVSIRQETKRIEGSDWNTSGSAYASEEHDGWPAIWKAVEMHGSGGGCGNHNQHQLAPEGKAALLIDGVYELKGGRWHRIEEKP